MPSTLALVDRPSLDDLQVFLGRAARVDDASVRIVAGSGVLAVYVSVLHPIGLLDASPTVLGLRTFALAPSDDVDAVVPLRSLLARIEGAATASAASDAPVPITVPSEVTSAAWAAVSPPRGGWRPLEPVATAALDAAARAGIDEVAAAVPGGLGEQLVHKVRTEVWGRPLESAAHLPAGVGFAALSLGFLGTEPLVQVYESGSWTRVSSHRGHVLVKRRGGLLG